MPELRFRFTSNLFSPPDYIQSWLQRPALAASLFCTPFRRLAGEPLVGGGGNDFNFATDVVPGTRVDLRFKAIGFPQPVVRKGALVKLRMPLFSVFQSNRLNTEFSRYEEI